MAERPGNDSLSPQQEDGDPAELQAAPRGRSEFVIAFGVVAIMAMIFGFLLGLLF
jgi:hypothetical protein